MPNSVEPVKGKLYVSAVPDGEVNNVFDLDFVEPETGEIIWPRWTSAMQGSPYNDLHATPLLFLGKNVDRNGYCLYDFLFLEKRIQTILHNDQDFGDFFLVAE